MQKKRASMHDGPLADLFRATEASRDPENRQDPREAVPPREPLIPPVAREATPERPPAPAAPPAPRGETRVVSPFGVDVLAPARPSPVAQGSSAYLAVIRVVGVGGGGVNAVDRMVTAGINGVEFVAVNTDAQQLAATEASKVIHIGRDLTQGLGSGADPDVGRRSAEEADSELREALRGADLVFVTAGEGGGTGTGAAPVVARIARELGALTIGIVTLPFRFEGPRRRQQAEVGMRRLAECVDTLVAIPNDRLLQVLDRRTSMVEAFDVADDILRQGVQGICDLITTPGLINLDFADVRTIMKDAGTAQMGVGMASGPSRAREAARRAVTSPLVGRRIAGARGILLSVSGGSDLSLHDVTEVADVVREAADESANIIFGATVDPALGDQVWVTVIATGFDADVHDRPAAPRSAAADAAPAPAPAPAASQPVRDRASTTSDDLVLPPEFRMPVVDGDDELDVPAFLR